MFFSFMILCAALWKSSVFSGTLMWSAPAGHRSIKTFIVEISSARHAALFTFCFKLMNNCMRPAPPCSYFVSVARSRCREKWWQQRQRSTAGRSAANRVVKQCTAANRDIQFSHTTEGKKKGVFNNHTQRDDNNTWTHMKLVFVNIAKPKQFSICIIQSHFLLLWCIDCKEIK